MAGETVAVTVHLADADGTFTRAGAAVYAAVEFWRRWLEGDYLDAKDAKIDCSGAEFEVADILICCSPALSVWADHRYGRVSA